jgi:hypothetical protein
VAFSSYLLRRFFANPGEALRIKRAGDEVRAYAVWKLYEVLEGSGLLAKLQEQPWWSFGDRDLARVVCDTLVAEGLADRAGDVIRVKRRPQRPAITTREAADFAPVFDRAFLYLPRALETGEKPPQSEVRAEMAKLLDNFATRLEMEVAVEETGLSKLGEGAVIADLYPRSGASTMVLLERTRARVIAVDPYRENLAMVERLVKLAGQEARVSYVQAPLEEAKLPEKVDAVFMAEVVHWTFNPRLALARARENMKREGFLAVAQSTYSSLGLPAAAAGLLLGALAPPPASGELRGMIREAGFSIEKWLESLGVVIAKAAPE